MVGFGVQRVQTTRPPERSSGKTLVLARARSHPGTVLLFALHCLAGGGDSPPVVGLKLHAFSGHLLIMDLPNLKLKPQALNSTH